MYEFIDNNSFLANFLFKTAPKFRNSFAGTMPDMKSSRRPNSIISLSSSASSGESSVSSTCNKSSSEPHADSDRLAIHCRETQKDKKNAKQEKNVPCKFKYSRSTTVVSQCSTGKNKRKEKMYI